MISYLVLLVTMYVAYLLKQYFSTWRFSEQFPGRKTIPLIGNGHQMGNNPYGECFLKKRHGFKLKYMHATQNLTDKWQILKNFVKVDMYYRLSTKHDGMD